MLKLRSFRAGVLAQLAPGRRAKDPHRLLLLNGLVSILAKFMSAGATLISIPVTLSYLGQERFGMWMAISSAIAVMSFADLGIGNGVVNQIASAKGRDDRNAIREIVSSALCTLATLAVVFGAVLLLLREHINWPKLLNVQTASAISDAGPTFIVVGLLFAANIPMGLFPRILAGMQQTIFNNLFQCIASACSLIFLLLAIRSNASMAVLGAALVAAPAVSCLCACIFYFRLSNKTLRPSLELISRERIGIIFRAGVLFLALQLLGALAYTSDNLIIARTLGSSAVSQYAIPDKVFSQIPLMMGMFLAPLWPAYAEAISRGDGLWIKRTLRRSLVVTAGVGALCSVLVFLFAPAILKVWVGRAVEAPLALLVGLAVWKVVEVICLALAVFLNGANVITTQLLLSSLVAIIGITAKIHFIEDYGLAVIPIVSCLTHIFLLILPNFYLLPSIIKTRIGSSSVPPLTNHGV